MLIFRLSVAVTFDVPIPVLLVTTVRISSGVAALVALARLVAVDARWVMSVDEDLTIWVSLQAALSILALSALSLLMAAMEFSGLESNSVGVCQSCNLGCTGFGKGFVLVMSLTASVISSTTSVGTASAKIALAMTEIGMEKRIVDVVLGVVCRRCCC